MYFPAVVFKFCGWT